MSCSGTGLVSNVLAPYQSSLLHASVALLFESAAKRLFVYLTHSGFEFSNTIFCNVLKSTLLDDPIIEHLKVLFESAIADESLPISVPHDIQQKVLDCIHLIDWVTREFDDDIANIPHVLMIRGFLLASNPQLTEDELKNKFLKIYGDCDICGATDTACQCELSDPEVSNPEPSETPEICQLGNLCDTCSKISSASSRFIESVICETPIGEIMYKSIVRIETSQ